MGEYDPEDVFEIVRQWQPLPSVDRSSSIVSRCRPGPHLFVPTFDPGRIIAARRSGEQRAYHSVCLDMALCERAEGAWRRVHQYYEGTHGSAPERDLGEGFSLQDNGRICVFVRDGSAWTILWERDYREIGNQCLRLWKEQDLREWDDYVVARAEARKRGIILRPGDFFADFGTFELENARD